MRALKAIGLTTIVIAVYAFTADASRAQEKAQDWPNRPVRVVVPFGAGGAADRLGRIAADHLSKAFKQQFYIENRVGAGGAVASKDIVRADPDGYTLLIGGSGPHIMGPAENASIGYDPVGDFTHIAMIGGESYALSAQASLGVKTFEELIALSNSKAARSTSARPAWARSASSMSNRCSFTRSPTSITCHIAAARRCSPTSSATTSRWRRHRSCRSCSTRRPVRSCRWR